MANHKRWKCCLAGAVVLAATAGMAEPAAQVLARIALLSDTHTCAVTNHKHALYKAHLLQAVAEVNAARVDLVLIAGDLTDHGKSEEMEEFQQEIRGFAAPVWFVPGNHDLGNAPSADRPAVVSSDRVETFEKRLGPSYFERASAGIRVIGINASLFGSGLPREAEMWRFLEARLGQTNGEPVFLLSHYPPFLKSVQEPASYYNIEPAARARLLSLLSKGNVAAVFSGHYHRSLVNRLGQRVFVTTPPISFGLPAGARNEGWTLVTVAKSGEIFWQFKLLKP